MAADQDQALRAVEKEMARFKGSAQLSKAVGDVDRIIDQLVAARETVAAANDPHTTSLTLTKLQNPIRQDLEALNEHLKVVNSGQKRFGKALDKAFEKKGALPTEHDPMAEHGDLINRAIAMHLLREGQFSVASTFISEAQTQHRAEETDTQETMSQHHLSQVGSNSTETQSTTPLSPPPISTETPTQPIDTSSLPKDLTALHSTSLQASFATMYSILKALKSYDLLPAIDWARQNSPALTARGSNLEFELCKLQFLWLFQGPSVNALPDDPSTNGKSGALAYARENFSRFQVRHLKEIQRLICAMVYEGNLPASPYRDLFDTTHAFSNLASSFTREFCSLLGLSAESPLYIAATAGAITLPLLIKYTSMVRSKNTEWTTAQELAFETPLPRSMIYHSIFVCPVSKEQTTDANPPMMLPCGHVIAKESLQRLSKGNRFKCPYCPNEGVVKDAREIIL